MNRNYYKVRYFPVIRDTAVVLLAFSILFLSHCEPDIDAEGRILLPKEVLDIPNLEDIQADVYSTTAFDINDRGIIIGWTEGSNRPLYSIYDRPSRGFSTGISGDNYHTIASSDSYSVWPFRINNNNVVVGAYVHRYADLKPGAGKSIPCRAFYANHDGSAFHDVHPDGYAYSQLIQVNDDGLAVGFCGNDLEFHLNEKYFLYDTDNTQPVELPFNAEEPYIIRAINNHTLIVSFNKDPNDFSDYGTTVLFSLDAFLAVDTIPMDEIPGQDAVITGMSENNRATGTYTDLQDFGFQGFTWEAGDTHLRLIDMDQQLGKWHFTEFYPHDINGAGEITGTGFRTGEGLIFPQARACRISWDLTGFEDITPSNRDAYAEAYAINNNSQIVGYAGFLQDFHSLVVNRAFVVGR